MVVVVAVVVVISVISCGSVTLVVIVLVMSIGKVFVPNRLSLSLRLLCYSLPTDSAGIALDIHHYV